MSEEKQIMKIVDNEGKEIDAEVLVSFSLEDTGNQYVVYTLNEEDNEGNVTIYTSIVIPDGDNVKLQTIESDEEWAKVKDVIRELAKNEENNPDESNN